MKCTMKKRNGGMRATQPSPLWGRGWTATRALTSGGGPGEGVELVKTQYPYRTLGLDPLTPTQQNVGPPSRLG